MTMKALRSRLGAVIINVAGQQGLSEPDLAAMGTDEMVEYLQAMTSGTPSAKIPGGGGGRAPTTDPRERSSRKARVVRGSSCAPRLRA